MPKLVDFHCHLDLYPDFEAVVVECDRASIYTLAVTTTPRAWQRNRELAATTRHVRVGLGLHPQLVASHGKDMAIWERLLGEADYVGEVGLDASPQYLGFLPEQRRIFSRILRCCSERGGLVLSIHAIRSVSMVLDMIEQHLDLDHNSPVLHWFSGSAAEAKRAAALGCSFSINNQMLGKSKTTALLAAIPEASDSDGNRWAIYDYFGQAQPSEGCRILCRQLGSRLRQEPARNAEAGVREPAEPPCQKRQTEQIGLSCYLRENQPDFP